MKDFLEVLTRIQQLEHQGKPAVLATILRVAGSTYRRPGARMVVEPDGTITGMVSGGCLETDVIEHCKKVLQEGKSRLLHYDTMAEDEAVWGLGSGCNGKIDVLLEPLPIKEPAFNYIKAIHTVVKGYHSAWLWTVIEAPQGSEVNTGAHVLQLPNGEIQSDIADAYLVEKITSFKDVPPRKHYANYRFTLPDGEVEVLLERITPPTRLFIFGAGKDAEPLVEAAAQLGWRAWVYDHRPAYARKENFPAAQVVEKTDYRQFFEKHPLYPTDVVLIMTHLYLQDKILLEQLVTNPPAYLGVLGPRRRTEQLLNELRRSGIKFHAQLSERLFSPIGLDIGAETPEEIAFSIMAEILAVMRGREGGQLRKRKGPIHG